MNILVDTSVWSMALRRGRKSKFPPVQELRDAYWRENFLLLSGVITGHKVSKLSLHDFEDLRRELISRKYSYKTVKVYLYYNRDFLDFIGKRPSEVEEKDIKDYLFHLAEEKQAATSTLNQAINALKFYYGTMLKKKLVYEVKRPRKDKNLPVVLSQEEAAKILSSVDNIKHKAILMLIYSAGLRVGEVVKIRPEDIDAKRMLIFIQGV